MALPYMQRRSAVLELLAHGQLLFVLTNSGLCSVHHMGGERHAAGAPSKHVRGLICT